MNKNPKQTASTKLKLKEAFWDLYANKPISQITVQEITQLAGYNRGTFYVYYKDVYDVLEQTENEIFNVFTKHQAIMPCPADEQQFDSTMKYFVEFFKENKKYLILLMGEKGDPQFTRKI